MIIDEKRFYSAKEVIVANGGILPMSVSAVYVNIRKNIIPSKVIGRRKMIPGSYLKKLLEEPPQATSDRLMTAVRASATSFFIPFSSLLVDE